jgi:hypothetical protein
MLPRSQKIAVCEKPRLLLQAPVVSLDHPHYGHRGSCAVIVFTKDMSFCPSVSFAAQRLIDAMQS